MCVCVKAMGDKSHEEEEEEEVGCDKFEREMEVGGMEEMAACSFEQWYTSFEAHAWRGESVRLSDAFLKFLSQDGVRVGRDTEAFPKTMELEEEEEEESRRGTNGSEGNEDEEEKSDDESDDDDAMLNFDDFPDEIAWIRGAVSRLGGRVAPKLNWSCPYDAAWVSQSGSVCCSTPDDVLLLLKSSDRTAHDLSEIAERGHTPILVLKKFFELLPGREFRCFVHRDELVGTESYHRLCVVIRATTQSVYIHAFVCDDDVGRSRGLCYEHVLTDECADGRGGYCAPFPWRRCAFSVSRMLSLPTHIHQESANAMCSSVSRRPCAAISA